MACNLVIEFLIHFPCEREFGPLITFTLCTKIPILLVCNIYLTTSNWTLGFQATNQPKLLQLQSHKSLLNAVINR